jgi:hypothetical protein
MRILKLNLLAAALLLFGATSASAFAINMVARGPVSSLGASDHVVVDVFLDAEAGLTLLGVNVLATDATLNYDGPASAAVARCVACTGGGTSGAQPSYILYTPAGPKNMPPATNLLPQQTPAFLNWPIPPVGYEQVNINYAEPSFAAAPATGTGIWIATLVWHVTGEFDTAELIVSITAGGGIVQTGGIANPTMIPPSDVTLSAPILLTGHLPEPTTAMLIGLGVVGLVVAGRRRA